MLLAGPSSRAVGRGRESCGHVKRGAASRCFATAPPPLRDASDAPLVLTHDEAEAESARFAAAPQLLAAPSPPPRVLHPVLQSIPPRIRGLILLNVLCALFGRRVPRLPWSCAPKRLRRYPLPRASRGSTSVPRRRQQQRGGRERGAGAPGPRAVLDGAVRAQRARVLPLPARRLQIETNAARGRGAGPHIGGRIRRPGVGPRLNFGLAHRVVRLEYLALSVTHLALSHARALAASARSPFCWFRCWPAPRAPWSSPPARGWRRASRCSASARWSWAAARAALPLARPPPPQPPPRTLPPPRPLPPPPWPPCTCRPS